MINRYIIITMLIGCSLASSCRKYVEVDQYNERTLKYTSDFQMLLNNAGTFERWVSMPILSSDDISLDGNPTLHNALRNELAKIYTWAADYYTNEQSDVNWDQIYNQVYQCNEIIAHVMQSINGTEAEKKKVLAEAKVQRAYAYLTLVNMYAPVYRAASATADPGVPLLLSPDLFTPLNRASVQAVYDQILLDLTEAIPSLPATPNNNIHPGKAAAYATLARTYLYMQRYKDAAEHAALALSLKNTLLDLVEVANGTIQYPRRLLNPEVILGKKAGKIGYLDLPLSAELLDKFDPNDLRYSLLTRPGTSFQPSFQGRGSYRDRLFFGDEITAGVSVPEMMLIEAEGLAREGQASPAMDLINQLRGKRFKPEHFTLLTAADADEALRIVLDERRRELFGLGLRWFDQRRLSLEPAFAEVETRTLNGTTFKLEPGNRYIYPVSPKNLDLNPEIEQSPR